MSPGAPAPKLRTRGRHSRARAGDPEAFAVLYARHEQELFRYCRSILRSEEDARDALQNTMVKAFSALQTERRDLALRPWLFRIAHNESISLIRRRPATSELDETLGGAEDTVERTVETRERLALLRADLQDLPERQRGALVMRELSGLSHEQIGEALGTSARAVKQTLYEARSSLNDCAEGRAMECEAVQRALSDGDGRISRSRRMRAHLRSCRTCERFRVALVQRPAELAALSPAMPLLGASGVAAALEGTAVVGGAAGGTAAVLSTGAGGGFAASILAAGAAKVAVVATAVTVAGGAAVVVGTTGGDGGARAADAPTTSTGTRAVGTARSPQDAASVFGVVSRSVAAPASFGPGATRTAGAGSTGSSRAGTATAPGASAGKPASHDAAKADRAAAKADRAAAKADRAAAKDPGSNGRARASAAKQSAAARKAERTAAGTTTGTGKGTGATKDTSAGRPAGSTGAAQTAKSDRAETAKADRAAEAKRSAAATAKPKQDAATTTAAPSSGTSGSAQGSSGSSGSGQGSSPKPKGAATAGK